MENTLAHVKKKFGERLSQGVGDVAKWQNRRKQDVERDIEDRFGVTPDSLHRYYRGEIPKSPDSINFEKIIRYCAEKGRMSEDWAREIVSAGVRLGMVFSVDKETFIHELMRGAGSHVPALAKPSTPRPRLHELSPFVLNVPIQHPRQFFGREKELRKIFNRLKLSHDECFSIIGPRRVGKTSFLYYLKNITQTPTTELRPDQIPLLKHLPNLDHVRWLWVDFQDTRMCDKEYLLPYLLNELNLPVPDPCNLNNFMRAITPNLQQKTVILMDEVEAAMKSPDLGEAFWNCMRSLITHDDCHVTFITSARDTVVKLRDEARLTSEFFNYFRTLELGPFIEAEACALIASSPIPFAPEVEKQILAESGLWPNKLQQLCQETLEELEG
ncbi:MAG: ATP-binding protein [Anaerolineales bacterium]|nr:ATP-binding protein [Anaerolineales bacterium]